MIEDVFATIGAAMVIASAAYLVAYALDIVKGITITLHH